MSREPLGAVAVFQTKEVEGEVVVSEQGKGSKLVATFTKLPPGKHGFHIHKSGDLRGDGCQGLCEHYDIGQNVHGGSPTSNGPRHTGDLGNIEMKGKKLRVSYELKDVSVKELWGRSIIVHEEEDDLGKGPFEDSLITGHSGRRMGCAIFGRTACSPKYNTTRKKKV